MRVRDSFVRTTVTFALAAVAVSTLPAQGMSYGVLVGGVAAKVTEIDVSSAVAIPLALL